MKPKGNVVILVMLIGFFVCFAALGITALLR